MNQPCSQCGRIPLNPRLKYCRVCRANATVALYLAFERSQEEQKKAFHLYRLRAVLIVASLYLTKSEEEAIRQTINDAIYYGTAGSISALWTGWERRDRKHGVQESLERLRDRGYIDYPHANGERGNYPILLNKAEPTLGVLRGWRLRLTGERGEVGTSDFENPLYEYVSSTPWAEAYGDWEIDYPTPEPLWRPVGLQTSRLSALALLDEDEARKPYSSLKGVLELTRTARAEAATREIAGFSIEDEDDELS